MSDPSRVPNLRIGDVVTRLPIVAAPMAGGPTTPALVAAVSEAGGLGMLAAGYLTVDTLRELVVDVEGRTRKPYGVNIFLSGSDALGGDAPAAALADYRAELAIEAGRLGVELGEARHTDEQVDAKLEMLTEYRLDLVTFTFGDPGGDRIAVIHDRIGAMVGVTVSNPEEATVAIESGADVLIAQGREAGGHRGIWSDDPEQEYGGTALATTELVRAIRSSKVSDAIPVIAAGGVMDGAAISAMIALGATAVQMGTAFLCVDEAGTSATHRRALLGREYDDTVVTRAFSGRPARSLRNSFTRRHAGAPALYPHVHHMTKPLRAASGAAGDADGINLWAGTGWRAVTVGSTASLMARLEAEFIDAS